MRSPIAAIVILGLAGTVSAQDKKYESKEGKYSVTFPGKPTSMTQKAGEIELNITIVEKGGGGMAVIYSDLPGAAVKDAKPKDILEKGEKGLIDNFKAKVTKSKDIEFGKQKFPAREITGEKDSLQLRITIILVENRLYQVFVVGPKDLVEGKDTEDFFKSFEVTK